LLVELLLGRAAAMNDGRSLYILGTRGVPARHGGFETFAERLATHMVKCGWRVTVYCQRDTGPTESIEDRWEGVRRITFTSAGNALGTIKFDWRAMRHAQAESGVMLALGYNTAVFSVLLRLGGHALLTNMDGLDWKRAKWPWYARVWLYANEWVGALTSKHLIADHPDIAKRLGRRCQTRKISMIPYGADPIYDSPVEPVIGLGVK
jgi:hypothetical protein